MQVLLIPQNKANVMAHAPHVISGDKNFDFSWTNVESAISNDDSTIKKKKHKDVNELHAEL